MSQVPPQFNPQASFATEAIQPITRVGLPGAKLDAEFSRASESINGLVSRLSEIQRDDGALRNGVVDLNSLSGDVFALLISLGVNPIVWKPGLAIKKGDLVSNPEVIARIEVTGDISHSFTIGMSPGGVPSITYHPTSFPPLFRAVNDMNGKPLFADVASGAASSSCYFNGSVWVLSNQKASWKSTIEAESPELVVLWVGQGQASGAPIITRFFPSITHGTYLAVVDHTSSGTFAADAAKWATVATKPEAGDLIVDAFTGNGATTSFVLSDSPIEEVNTQVFINGIYQPKSAYAISGANIVFGAAPANLAAIEVVSGISVQKAILTVSDFSISTDKLIALSVTEAKIADGAVSAAKLASGAVVTDRLADLAVTAEKIAAGAISEEKLSIASVGTSQLIDAAVIGSKIAQNSIDQSHLSARSVSSTNLAPGPLLLNGATTPMIGKHVVTKEYLERASSVFGSMIGNSAVLTPAIANLAVTSEKLSSQTSMPCQMKGARKSSTESIGGSASSWTDIPGLEIEINRVFPFGRMRVQASISCASSSSHPVAFRVLRNGSAVGSISGTSRTEALAAGGSGGGVGMDSVSIDVIDDLAGNASITHTYKVQARTFTGSTAYINRSQSDPADGSGIRGISQMVLTELTS